MSETPEDDGFITVHGFTHSALRLEAGGNSYVAFSDLDRLWCGHRAWSDATFGSPQERGPVGALKHLAKEALEAAADPTDITEFVDCLFLLWDGVHRAGFTMEQVIEAGFRKLQVLHTRTYDRATPPDQPAEHDRSGEA
ncbi:Domain of unknown function DUF550 [uncultured Caudovirales phage]|uniref:dATP/dGTP diphosphohydrolase MazZ domain-containing protein n=1 Tax=uncultured Caudovirales phage TaxID=2100421 RepID=A0A6J7WQ64_9CAUD|nr:Domain of unknown function DUF550 [uncultured Caudovirales phage]